MDEGWHRLPLFEAFELLVRGQGLGCGQVARCCQVAFAVFAHFAEDMILRFDFFRDWIEGGIPVAYWISSFYFPQASRHLPASLRPSQSCAPLVQGFLTSVLQGHSRKELIPVDQLSFEFVMQD